MVKHALLAQEAEKKGWLEGEDVKLRLDFMRKKLIAELAAYSVLKEDPITEEDVKAFYEQKISEQEAPIEYHARHILVKTEEEAKELIAQLDKGADFAKLAEEHSLDKGSAKKGGDLDWFRKEKMVEPFGNGVAALEKGKYSAQPVQSDFGWHVILLEDKRDAAPPPYERLRASLAQELQSNRIREHLDALEAKAEIKIHEGPAAVETAPKPE
jgi:peptidyl-prolyl cis-trans isomerase C